MKIYDPEIWFNETNGYEELLENIKASFAAKMKDNIKTPLFRTDATGLFDTFLQYIPDTYKQEYTCRTCQHFVDRFGGLVFIKEDGTTESAIWNVDNIPGMFQEPIAQMKEIVESANVQDVFVSDYVNLGTFDTNGFHHFSVNLPRIMLNTSRIKKASQVSAEKAEDYGMLKRALEKYSMPNIEQALNILESGSLYRGDSYVGRCKWFKEVKEKISVINNQKAHINMIWKCAATAPNGFTHISGSMLGTLLNDIVTGYNFDAIKSRFENNMSAENYRRAQSAPTQRAVESAEKTIEKLGLADSLRRRYATLDELPENEFIWKSKEEKKEVKTGIFSGVQTKAVLSNEGHSVIPQVTMTWDKFRKTILPTVDKLEVKVEGTSHLMGMVTASVPDSENIMNWDNPFSWYYQSGIDSVIKERVEAKGGKYENCEIRCSLLWNTRTDLDVHCICPDGFHIYFGKKTHGYGSLDVDANVYGETTTPVENIRWPICTAPNGRYQFYVHDYTNRANNNPYKLELEVNGKVYTYEGNLKKTDSKDVVFEFDYVPGEDPKFTERSKKTDVKETWGISNGFSEVSAIIPSPNMWGENPYKKSGEHTFFLLKGCKDMTGGVGRGFFTEMLKGDLQEIRKTLEAYTAATPIEGEEETSACGVGYSKDKKWNLIVKVTTGNTVKMIKLDRFD